MAPEFRVKRASVVPVISAHPITASSTNQGLLTSLPPCEFGRSFATHAPYFITIPQTCILGFAGRGAVTTLGCTGSGALDESQRAIVAGYLLFWFSARCNERRVFS